MKKLIILSTVLCMFQALQAQKDVIDDFFDKYSEREGFTTVYISSKLLSLFTPKDAMNNGSNVINRITSIRILTAEDSLMNMKLNFFKELSSELNLSVYEELMVVKEASEVTKFLIRQKGDKISELLVISGGPGNNVLISIRGDLDLKSISRMSKDLGIEELEDLENIEKKAPE